MVEITDYIKKWLVILDEMRNDNTYKLAWGRAILELCQDINIDENSNEEIIIDFKDIGKKMLKYYWNQIFYFNLKQTSDNVRNRVPEMVQYTNDLIREYKETYQTSKPEWFNKVYPNKDFFLNERFNKIIECDIPKTLKQDVSWRFLRVMNNDDIGVYKYVKKTTHITLNKSDIIQLKEFGKILIQLFNYKWSLLLEKYNYAPKIGNKVNGSGYEEIKRNSLTPYKKILLIQYGEEQPRDFYTNEVLSENDISIDHVIPWSFIYEDDIWNLVITSKSNNSSKSNSFVSEEFIEKLIQRNEKLINILQKQQDEIYEKYIDDLQMSIKNNTVQEMYHYFK